MNEQDLKQMKKPDIEVVGTPTSKTPSSFHGNQTYLNEDFRHKIMQDRSESPPKQWTIISNELNDLYNTKISPNAVKNIFNQEVARTITIEKKLGKKFNKYEVNLENLFYRTIRILEKLLDNIENVEESFKSSSMTDLQKQISFMKMTPAIKQTIDSIFGAIKVQQDQLDKIKIEQKNMVYSDAEIRDKMKTHLSRLVREGKIKIIREDPFLPKK